MTHSTKLFLALTALLWAAPESASAQSGLSAGCEAAPETVRNSCVVAAQAVESAQPVAGILLAGGNPTLGTASTGGLRLGVLPRVSASLRANLARVDLPAARETIQPTDEVRWGDNSFVAPALTATASVGILSGASASPTVGGIGSVDLLVTAGWLPLGSDFRSGSSLAYGAGVRVGLLRESFTVPGVSLSLVRHRLGTVRYGDVCPDGTLTAQSSGPGFTLDQGTCGGDPGDALEFATDLSGWSGRAAVSKQLPLTGLALSGGIGRDRWRSDVQVAARQVGMAAANGAVVRLSDVELEQSRWSAFVGAAYTVLAATMAAELGWMAGGDAIDDYPASLSDFDPDGGTFFGSFGLRVAL